MNAQTALDISIHNAITMGVESKEYDNIIRQILHYAKQGKTKMPLGFKLIAHATMQRLMNEGYEFYIVGGGFYMPTPIFYISWAKKQKPKRKWYQKLFN